MGAPSCDEEEDDAGVMYDDMSSALDGLRRESVQSQQLYQAMDSTKELAERHYFDVKQEDASRDLVPINEFWWVHPHLPWWHSRVNSMPALCSYLHVPSSSSLGWWWS